MALRKCKECGKEISTDIKVCPNCGKKQPNIRRNIGCLILFAIFFIPFLTIIYSSHRNPEQKITSKKEIVKNKLIEHKTLRQWNIPAGGIGVDILVSEKAKKEEVMALAKALRNNYYQNNFFLNIFDSEEAYENRFNENYPLDEYRKHWLLQVSINKKTGCDEITWVAKNRIEIDMDK